MKENSNKQPETLLFHSGGCQVRWNIERRDRATVEGGEVVEMWDFDCAECKGASYPELVEGIVRSRYPASAVEALTANYLDGKDTDEFAAFQQFRQLAKAVANGLHTKAELDSLQLNPVNDRIGELETATSTVIEVLNDKNIL